MSNIMQNPSDIPDISPKATIITGVAKNGKPCSIVDNTGQIKPETLQAMLDQFIEENRFGFSLLSAPGESSIRLGEPLFAHIQIEEQLYRVILHSYEIRIDSF